MSDSGEAKSARAQLRHREELFTIYRNAIEEYRFAVNLGWERQKFFVGLSSTLSVGLAGFASRQASDVLVVGLAWAFVASALVSMLGAGVVFRSHEYYRNARDHFQRVEARLELHRVGLALTTTSGMQEGHDARPRTRRLRVMYASVAVLIVLSVVQLFLAYRLLSS